MPKNKFQEVIFTIIMVFVMVYAMICYNIVLNTGTMTNETFLLAFHELTFMGPIAFILDFFIIGGLAKKIAFGIVDMRRDNPFHLVLAISAVSVAFMCPCMSFAATVLIKHAPASQIIPTWLQTTAMNFPMAFFWQIFYAGPFVRFIFGKLFPEKESAQTSQGVAARTVAMEAAPDRKKPGLLDRIADHLRRYWQLWILSAPALFFVGLFSYVPMWGIQLAFREFDPTKGLTGGKFVGFKYFLEFFHNPLFGEIMTNTIRISLWTLVMGFIFPIILALLINQIGSKKIKGFVQTITYMPHFISVVVIVSMLNIFLTPGTGILGRFFGEESLMGSTSAITAVYWISEVWQHVGWNSIIYLAALAGVNTSLYEAAKIDGAGRLQLIRYVDIPAIMPTCAILLIMNMGSVLNVGFDKIYLMQNSLNMPATEVIATYTYKIGIINGQYSYSTAIGLFNTLVNFIFLITANAIAKRVSDTSIF